MNLVLMAEGARLDLGRLGMVAIPEIARALAQRGHRVVLETFGPTIPGSEDFVTTDPTAAFRQNLVAITYPARGTYSLSTAGMPHVWDHIGRADYVMLHSLYSFAVLAGYGAARAQGKKYGIWLHGVLAPFQRMVSAKRKAFYNRLFADGILEHASVIFYNAVGERDETAPLRLTAPSVIIPHGIEMREFTPMPARGAFRGKHMGGFDGPLVLYVGRFHAKKGLDLLIEAMAQVCAQVPDARLAMLGTGDPPEFGRRVEEWIAQANLTGRVVMPGLVTGRAKLEALADADVFALPSYAENFSFAMFEAMASKLPVVVTNSLNFAPQVQAQHAGFVLPRQARAVSDAIVTLLNDPTLRAEMGRRGAELASTFSWQTIGEQMERTIELVLAGRPLPNDLTLAVAPGRA